jgi:hypothetical protein
MLQSFTLIGSPGNTSEDGFFLDSSSYTNSGMYYSIFEDIQMQNFNGVSLHFRSSPNNFASSNQFILFMRVDAYRGTGLSTVGEGLRMEGASQNNDFINCVFQGLSGTRYGQDIYLGTYASGTQGVSSTAFWHVITQAANVAVNLNGSFQLSFHDCHMEGIATGAFNITNTSGTAASANIDVQIDHCYFSADGSYVNSGNGYLVSDASTTTAQYDTIKFVRNMFAQYGGTPPDHIIIDPGVPSEDPIWQEEDNVGTYTSGTGPGHPFATWFACAANWYGYKALITDDTTALAWGATVVGGGSNIVEAICNGTNWTIYGK